MTSDNIRTAAVNNNVAALSLPEDASLIDCVICIKNSRTGLVAFRNRHGRFSGILTLGDIIRLVADGHDLDKRVTGQINRNPVTIPNGTDSDEIIDLLLERLITAAPLIDDDGKLAGVATVPEYLRRRRIRCRAVIMAGGEGKRLLPLTADTPKPMLAMAGKPILERIIESLKSQGFRDITLTVRYLKQQVMDYFGDGHRFGVRISYVEEDEALGTCGALSLVPATEGPTFLMNSDLLTDLNFMKMVEYHHDNEADVCMAVKEHRFPVPYGVVQMDMNRVVALEEKPELISYVNAGIYVLSPRAVSLVPKGACCDATWLVGAALERGMRVLGYHMSASWIDVGALADYYHACDSFKTRERL
jgi:dTDP-glucose pyrophosphorylase/CBS domain-containing protein